MNMCHINHWYVADLPTVTSATSALQHIKVKRVRVNEWKYIFKKTYLNIKQERFSKLPAKQTSALV